MSVHRRTDSGGRTRYQVKWRENGRQRSRTFDRKKDAESFEIEVRRRQQLGPLAVQQLTSRGPTLDQWIAARWTPEHAAGLERSTRARYADVYRLHVAADLGGLPLGEITVGTLRAWQARLASAGVSAGTIQKARTFLSSVLRHAAESEAIPANPIALVRPPKSEHRDAVKPLAPASVERLRTALAGPMDSKIPGRSRNGHQVAGYRVPDERPNTDRVRDATIVSVLAYAGLRPGELRALRWGDVREKTLTVERAVDDDGNVKGTKTSSRRAVRLLTPLAQDLRELRLADGRPPEGAFIFSRAGAPWTKTDWQVWRAKRWTKAATHAGLATVPRPYDLRHSFASLLLAEGRTVHYVAAQLGHSPTLTLTTYGHLFAEYEDADRIDAEAEIAAARGAACSRDVPAGAALP